MRTQKEIIYAEGFEDEIRSLLKGGETAALSERLKNQHPADIAQVMERLSAKERIRAFHLLARSAQAEVLSELGTRVARQILGSISVGEIAQLLDQLPMDEAAQILSTFRRRRTVILQALNAEHAEDVRRLLTYPEHSAGRLMSEQFARVRPEWRASETLTRLRKMNANVETLNNLYVLDDEERLVGVVSLREVVIAPPRKRLRELMNTRVISVTPETDREEVARLISHYDYLAMPVIGADGRMLGIIPVDDVIDVLVAESGEDILKFGGLEGGVLDQPYFTIPLGTVVSRRVGWLLLLFVAETLTGTVLRFFESELAAVVALSFFIPLLIGTGGNTGAQTVSTLIRGLALGEIGVKDVWRVIRRELLSGFSIGLILGTVAFGRALLWGSAVPLALTVGLAILAICTWANTIGSLIPLIAQRFKIDPATVSAPLITTLVDATGLAIYLLIAKVSLGL